MVEDKPLKDEHVKIRKIWLVLSFAVLLVLLIVSINLYNQVDNIDYCVKKDANATLNDTIEADNVTIVEETEDQVNVTLEENVTELVNETNEYINIS